MISTPQFTRSVAANVTYWRRRTSDLNERKLGVLDRERRNLYRAAEFGLALAETWRDTAELILQSFDLIERRGYWREWIPVLQRVRDSCCGEDLALCGRILDQLGIFYRLDRQLEAAITTHQEEKQIGLQLDDESRLAHARLNLSVDERLLRQYEEAKRYGLAALAGFTALGANKEKIAFTYNNLGLIAHACGDLPLAEERLKQAITLWQQVSQPINLARAINNLALTLEAAGKVDAALQGYTESSALLATTDNELDKIKVELSLGTLFFNQGQLAEAETAFRRADSSYLQQSGHTYYQALAANNLGNVYLAQGRLAEAEIYLHNSIALWRQTVDRVMLANSLGTLAETLVSKKKPELAASFYDEAIALLVAYPDDAWGLQLSEKFTAAHEKLEDTE